MDIKFNYENVIKRRPRRQPKKTDLGRVTKSQLQPPNRITGTNLFSGYGSYNTPQDITRGYAKFATTGYDDLMKGIGTDKGILNRSQIPSGGKVGTIFGAGSKVLPALSIAGAVPDVVFGNNPTSKAFSTAAAVAAMNPRTMFLSPLLFGAAGLNNKIADPQWQIDKSNRDFAKYEAQFGTPDNPNLGNLAPSLRPLTEGELAMLQIKDNAQQTQREMAAAPQETTSSPSPEQYQVARDNVTSDSVTAQNQLTDLTSHLQPQPVKYNSAEYGKNVYNPSPGLSAMTENRIDQMKNAVQNAPNLFSNLFGQGDVDTGSKALGQYIQMVGKQQEEKQALANKMLEGYQNAVKQDRYQDIMDSVGNAFQNYNYNRSLVFLPSGFNPNGGQTFTPYHLTNAPQEKESPRNVDRYMEELKLRQALAPDKSKYNEALERALQSQAFGEATGYNPFIFMGDKDLSKEIIQQVLGPQIKDASGARAALAKLEPELYKELAKAGVEAYANSVIERMKGYFGIAEKNIEQSAMTDRANADNQNKYFMEYMKNMTEFFKTEMNNKAALERLKLTGMNAEQLAQLKADLESSDPVKQVNATSQLMNAYTRFATPQEAEAYQSKLFPQGLPQFNQRRSP